MSGKEVTNNISYILKFIDSARFMASSLSSLIKCLIIVKCKYGHDNKKCETCKIRY